MATIDRRLAGHEPLAAPRPARRAVEPGVVGEHLDARARGRGAPASRSARVARARRRRSPAARPAPPAPRRSAAACRPRVLGSGTTAKVRFGRSNPVATRTGSRSPSRRHDVVGHRGRRGRGRAPAIASRAEPAGGVGEAEVVGPEVVPPLRDAVRLVDHEQPDLGVPDALQEPGRGEPLRRDVQQPHLPGDRAARSRRRFARASCWALTSATRPGRDPLAAPRPGPASARRAARRRASGRRASAPAAGSRATCPSRWASPPARRGRRARPSTASRCPGRKASKPNSSPQRRRRRIHGARDHSGAIGGPGRVAQIQQVCRAAAEDRRAMGSRHGLANLTATPRSSCRRVRAELCRDQAAIRPPAVTPRKHGQARARTRTCRASSVPSSGYVAAEARVAVRLARAADRLVDALERQVVQRVGAQLGGHLVRVRPWAIISSRVDMSMP